MTRKITKGVADIALGKDHVICLGNLDAQRDWGHAKDYVRSMWLILQQETPDDYVISTGKVYSVRQFVEQAFREIGITILWKGEGLDEIGVDAETHKTRIRVDPQFFRPTEVDFLMGDSKKARDKLGWEATIPFEELVKEMVQEDIKVQKIDQRIMTEKK